ncbi:hypothetical protein [Bacillus sp. es.034]|uniref:hypothetical protein n=1 Tax=Bacillus sp. es.034 TaxID=1761763 RepID=UPI000BF54DF2|nr:hypothetical protein [Bacillus sp. es.034]PFG04487.1 hypothetical protein ATG71_1233 [Bacillus sp. es.034]
MTRIFKSNLEEALYQFRVYFVGWGLIVIGMVILLYSTVLENTIFKDIESVISKMEKVEFFLQLIALNVTLIGLTVTLLTAVIDIRKEKNSKKQGEPYLKGPVSHLNRYIGIPFAFIVILYTILCLCFSAKQELGFQYFVNRDIVLDNVYILSLSLLALGGAIKRM